MLATDDLVYTVDVSDTTDDATGSSRKISLTRLGGFLDVNCCNGRLTTESGVPVSTSDRTSQGTLYFTPYNGNRISIYDGTRWKLYTFTEKSLSLTLTSGKNYDVFIYDNSGTLTLELSAAWTNDTTRADALTTQDGVTVKSGATTRRWLGTIRASGTNVTEDSAGGSTSQVGGKRFVWNAFNQIRRHMGLIDGTDNWTYGSSTWRQWNNTAANKVEYVTGDIATPVDSVFVGSGSVGNYVNLAIGVDSTSSPSGHYALANSSSWVPLMATYRGTPGLGYHYLCPLERATFAISAYFGGDDSMQSGLFANVWC